jgi:hypothetical protein
MIVKPPIRDETAKIAVFPVHTALFYSGNYDNVLSCQTKVST